MSHEINYYNTQLVCGSVQLYFKPDYHGSKFSYFIVEESERKQSFKKLISAKKAHLNLILLIIDVHYLLKKT